MILEKKHNEYDRDDLKQNYPIFGYIERVSGSAPTLISQKRKLTKIGTICFQSSQNLFIQTQVTKKWKV